MDAIKHATLTFATSAAPFEKDYAGESFGTLEIQMHKTPITKKHIHLLFTIDCSGSMTDECSDKRSKMQHIKHTLENMLRLFHQTPDCDISLYVQTFSNVITPVLNVPNIHSQPLESMLEQIQTIVPTDTTDIGLALSSAKSWIDAFMHDASNTDIVHIFLTDGDITTGIDDFEELLGLVPNGCANLFVGYGVEHDAKLLLHLSQKKPNEYRFIDALEKAGLVYGEIIHGILYKSVENVTIHVENGKIYDFQTNEWRTTLEIGHLLSEQKKTFHIKSSVSTDCKAFLSTPQEESYWFEAHKSPIPVDLTVYLFRQQTQEWLYKARQMSYARYNRVCKMDTQFKASLLAFYTMMMEYAEQHGLANDPLMQMLCDDIHIAYTTLGTHMGVMYTCSRQQSNGMEQAFVCGSHQPSFELGQGSQKYLSPFVSDGVLDLMRCVSSHQAEDVVPMNGVHEDEPKTIHAVATAAAAAALPDHN